MRQAVSEIWWINMLKATVAIVFGLVTIFWPGITLFALIYLLSAFVIVFGIIETVDGLMSVNRRSTWWITFLVGLLTLGVGIYLVRNPNVTLGTFILIVGFSFLAWGILEIIESLVMPLATSSRVMGFIAGLAGIGAGLITLFQPVSGGLAFVWVLGVYGIFYGIMTLSIGIGLRNEFEELTERRR